MDEANQAFTVTFADGVMVTLRNVENMHALRITVPYVTIAADTGLIDETQVCKGDLRLPNCVNGLTIHTYYDWDEELGRYEVCNETEGAIVKPPDECDNNVQIIARDVCSERDAPCLIPSLARSCEFDVCFFQVY